MEWIPGTGPLTLVMATTGLYALVVTAAALVPALWPGQHVARSRWMLALVLIALPGAALAFLSGHFLLRYAALEVVALCVALAPLLAAPDDVGSRQTSWAVYLLFRIGDAGLLAAILALYGRVGTLEIDPALAAGVGLSERRLSVVAAGFVLATWVKIGLWPFSIWLHAGRRLDHHLYAWLYLVLMPNLGLYMLYKVSPLLAASEPISRATAWIGATCAVISATVALFRRTNDEVALWSMQGGLLLWAAAPGLKPVVWIGLLLYTPLRLLSAWAFRRTDRHPERRAVVLLVGGLLLTAWNGLILAWATPHMDASRLVVQLSVTLTLIWFVRATGQQTRPLARRTAWIVGGTGTLILLGLGMSAGPLLSHLLDIAHAGFPAELDRLAWLRALIWPPTWLFALALAWGLRALSQKTQPVTPSLSPVVNVLRRLVDAFQAVIEKGLLENAVGLMARGIAGLSAWLYQWLEMGGLESTLHRAAHGVMTLSVWLHRRLEMSALEGGLRRIGQAGQQAGNWSLRRVEVGSLDALLYRIAETVQMSGRLAQRLHTGKLRINLLWVVLGLILATLALVFWAG